MADGQPATPSSMYGQMTDAQLRETITQLSRQQQLQNTTYQQNLQSWSSNPQATPKGAIPSQRSAPRTRALRSAASAGTSQTPSYTPPPQSVQVAVPQTTAQYAAPTQQTNPPPHPLPTMRQALTSTYPSRMRTGATLLMQPILTQSVAIQAAGGRSSRRANALVNYTDPGSGDELPDAGELESDDSDFQASGGTRTAIRTAQARAGVSTARMSAGMGMFHSGSGTPSRTPQSQFAAAQGKGKDLDQSYLGLIPPSRFIQSKPVAMTNHDYM
jgi:chromatin structure-remodeling complex subunit SFH1